MYPITVLAESCWKMLRSSLYDESRSLNLLAKFEIEGFIVVRRFRNSSLDVRNNMRSTNAAVYSREYATAMNRNSDITPEVRVPRCRLH